MENNTTKLNNKVYYSNNGKVSQNFPVKTTKIKSYKNNINHAKNGKNFINEFEIVSNKFDNNKENELNNSKSNVLSWIFNTVNPLNHLPVISSINKLANKTTRSLDMAQSAIGGALYGGSIGVAKGLGSWFVSKLFPNDIFASNLEQNKINNKVTPNNNEIRKIENTHIQNKDKVSANMFENLNKEKVNEAAEKAHSELNNYKNKKSVQYNNFFYHYSNDKILKENKIDIDA